MQQKLLTMDSLTVLGSSGFEDLHTIKKNNT